MGHTYFNGKTWADISREERLFCAHLYFAISKDIKSFVRVVNTQNPELKLDENVNWEVGYEVCFYRDYYYSFKQTSIKNSGYSQKRTFDLCLFSENAIVIIEAKSDQPFEETQIKDFVKDRADIRRILNKGDDFRVVLLALASKQYFDNYKKYSQQKGPYSVAQAFNGQITWSALNERYADGIFLSAENTYKRKRG